MRIKSISIKNFRSIHDDTLSCEGLTALVGPNGSGKSSFLKALDFFYTSNAKYAKEDFYNSDISIPIIVSITFDSLLEPEKELFKPYLDGSNITIEKELTWPIAKGSQRYFGSRLRNSDFQRIRLASKVTDKRNAYQELASSEAYSDLQSLPGNASGERIDLAMREWEESHSDRLQRVRDEGQFFGFREVGQAHLEKYTRFIYIPAVRDASEDATEGKGSVISELMDLVVRSTLSQRGDIREFQDATQRRYEEIMQPSELKELRLLEDGMTKTLSTFAPGSRVDLKWLPAGDFKVPMPTAEVKVIEDGYLSEIERVGHGVQRAFILTALQHLAIAQAGSIRESEMDQQGAPPSSMLPDTSAETPLNPIVSNLILGIEEPEIYQHPSRQRHLSGVLLNLAYGGISGVAQSTQIIYTTHSPLFVDLQRFDQIRLLRKEKIDDIMPKRTRVFRATIESVVQEIERADCAEPGTYLAEAERARLHTLMTPWTNEGFFADVVTLVEGEDDRAAIIGVAKALEWDLESLDIAVIPCMGKPNIHKAAAIFKNLKIPIYVVWDSDKGKSEEKNNNQRLLRLFGEPIEDYPAKVTNKFACFESNLDSTVREEITPKLYDTLLQDCKKCFSIDKDKQAMKNPIVVQTMIRKALESGERTPTLEQIVDNIVRLHQSNLAAS
jgi:predicted ATP-dependent endonuclease of OLD family